MAIFIILDLQNYKLKCKSSVVDSYLMKNFVYSCLNSLIFTINLIKLR